jgi:competence protein ComEC
VMVFGVPAPLARASAAPPGQLRLSVLDVGQAEAMLLQPPGAGALLVDTGGSPFGSGLDIGRRVVVPAMWARGVRSLAALLVTHGDPDHIGGATSVVASMPVGEAWLGIRVPTHAAGNELLANLAAWRVPVSYLRAGRAMAMGHMRVRVLHPPEPDWQRPRVRNDDSVVIEVLFGDVALLLAGDIGADVERTIVPQLTPARLRVLKVAHHGSRTSSSQALLEAWRPQLALISAGRGNTFGHPAPDVLQRLEAIGAVVLRTDRDGQITITTDGRALWWRTFLSPVATALPSGPAMRPAATRPARPAPLPSDRTAR